MIIDNNFTNGVRFEGDDGWIFVSRGGAKATASDPASAFGKALEASDPQILNSKIGPNEIHLHKSDDHHLDWLTSIQTRQPAVTTPEEAHRSTSACILGWIAMKLGRKLTLGPRQGSLHRRRRGQRHALPPPARPLRHRPPAQEDMKPVKP